MDDINLTPQLKDLSQHSSGNPLKLRGLMNLINNIYYEGISIDELEVGIGKEVQQKLIKELEKYDEPTKQIILSFLKNIDYTLVLENQKFEYLDKIK